jgi:hypothetical protein
VPVVCFRESELSGIRIGRTVARFSSYSRAGGTGGVFSGAVICESDVTVPCLPLTG